MGYLIAMLVVFPVALGWLRWVERGAFRPTWMMPVVIATAIATLWPIAVPLCAAGLLSAWLGPPVGRWIDRQLDRIEARWVRRD